MAEWTVAGSAAQLGEAEKVSADVDGEEVLVAHVGGEYLAVSATCTHAGCNLAFDGDLEGETVSCLCHGSVFDLHTGQAIGPPAQEPLDVYDVRIVEDEIQVAPRGA